MFLRGELWGKSCTFADRFLAPPLKSTAKLRPFRDVAKFFGYYFQGIFKRWIAVVINKYLFSYDRDIYNS